MTARIALAADMGEGYGAWSMGDDHALIQTVTAANIACGYHAGDPLIMTTTVRDCVRAGVGIGAHPSYFDLRGFGRRRIAVTPEELEADVVYQIGALQAVARSVGGRVEHVSPHGRLGNDVVTDPQAAGAFAAAVQHTDPGLIVLTQEGRLADAARERALPLALIGLIDRNYEPDGTLVARSHPEALIHDPDHLAHRAVEMARDGVVTALDGTVLELDFQCLVVHGDTSTAVRDAHAIRAALETAGVAIVGLREAVDA